jgi:hypothetical protein
MLERPSGPCLRLCGRDLPRAVLRTDGGGERRRRPPDRSRAARTVARGTGGYAGARVPDEPARNQPLDLVEFGPRIERGPRQRASRSDQRPFDPHPACRHVRLARDLCAASSPSNGSVLFLTSDGSSVLVSGHADVAGYVTVTGGPE